MKKKLIVFFALLASIYSIGQNPKLGKAEYPTVIQPSPEASALGKYGDVPVALSSGLAQVGVDIYSLKIGDIKVDVNLSYNSGGVRVDEIATSVGLGWSLNAGGVITRAILGRSDFMHDANPFPSSDFNPNVSFDRLDGINQQNPYYDDYMLAKQFLDENTDTERDIYYYNFLGQSGKFVVDRENKPRLIPYNPSIKIEFADLNPNNGFIITDAKGFKYYFNVSESITSITASCSVGVETPDNQDVPLRTAWYLSKIESPNKWVVLFEYENYSYTIEKSLSEANYYAEANGGCNLVMQNRSCKRIETIGATRLKRIFNSEVGSEVVFQYSTEARLDLTNNAVEQGKYLKDILIRHKNTTIKSWNLAYGYFMHQGTIPTRLKLLSVKEDSRPPYQFSYNETIPLPLRLSFSQDHWGYSNGKSNSSLIPSYPSEGIHSGADRNPDFSYMQSGSLARMTYPTGGSTLFTYEPHENTVTEDITNYVWESASVSVGSTTPGLSSEVTFTLPLGANDVKWEWVLTPDDPMGGQMSGAIYEGSTVLHSTGNGEGSQQLNKFVTTLAPGGSFKIKIERGSLQDFGTMSVSWWKPVTTSVTAKKIIFGGLRVQSVKHFGNANELVNERYYNYNSLDNPELSTAILPSPYYYNYHSTIVPSRTAFDPSAHPGESIEFTCGYDVLASGSMPALGNGINQSITYEQVVETHDLQGTNGRTIYKYLNNGDLGVSGILIEKTDQKKSGAQFINVQKSKNYYTVNYSSSCYINPSSCALHQFIVPNYKLSMVRPEQLVPDGNGPGSDAIYTGIISNDIYLTNIVPVYLDKTEEYTYAENGLDAVVNTTNYFYDNATYMMPTRLESITSAGKAISKQLKYPQDLAIPPGSTTNVYNEMADRNIVDQVVETTVINTTDDHEIAKNVTEYYKWPNDIIAPIISSSSLNGTPLVIDINFLGYDSKGNISKFKTREGLVKNYVWDYAQTLPVAEVTSSSGKETAYTSFETDSYGGWSLNGGSVLSSASEGVTGSRYYSGSLSKNLTASGDYILTLWTAPASNVLVNSQTGTQLRTHAQNGWKLMRWALVNVSVINVSSGSMDEVRLYPADGQMSTFTFNPLVGMTSQTSVADKISYFEYDEYTRLARIRDDEKNILKQYEYGYSAPIAGSSCGTNCLVLPMQTLVGTTTLSYPVGVFNVTGKLLGNAENQTAYVNLWNANAENQVYGTLAAGGDAMHFNLTFNNGVTPPSMVIGCRYYMFDLSYNQIAAVARYNAKYIDFGDSTGMYLGISSNSNTGVVLAPNTTEHFANGNYYYSHNYSDSSLKTLTFYHNDMAEETPAFGNGPSFVQATNLRGVFPQNANFLSVSCYPQPNGLTAANFSNWNTITSIKNFEIRNGNGQNSPTSSAPVQDFMANNRNLESISTNFYRRTGTSDPNLKFTISRLKSDWNIYFTQLKYLEINDDHWSREDLSQLKQLRSFLLLPVRQNLDVPNSPGVHIPSSVIDGIINQISSGSGQSVSNGSIFILSGAFRTSASNSAVNHLKSKGWTISINGMPQ